MRITLIGYMGAGKSTIGQKLADNLGLPFYDLDKEIEKDLGTSIVQTILKKGELYFRQLEREKLIELLKLREVILSAGGGTPCYYDNVEQINKHSVSIYLKYTIHELHERLEHRHSQRPMIMHLQGEELREFIAKHLFERTAYYEQATFTLKGGGLSEDEIIQQIKSLVNE